MHMHLKPNPQDNGVITKQFLKKLCRSDFKQYYSTPSLNDILYLHYKGFQKIDNLDEFTGLKVIYLEGNAIKKIQNLQKLESLRCLYIQQNLIRQISGLETLVNLVNLNLSDNLIEKITGLANLQKLSTFQIKRNRIGADGITDLIGLLQCPSISALDISDNKIQTQDIVTEVLQKMPNLSVIYMQNNGFNKKISHYRKALITKIPTLKYLDDKPVFDDEKRFAEAWGRGGLQQQRKQRILYKKQEQQKQIKQHEQFRVMIDRFKTQNKKKKQQLSQQSSDSLSDSQQQSLQTYNTPSESKQASQRTSQHMSQRVSDCPSQNVSDGQIQNVSDYQSQNEREDKQNQKCHLNQVQLEQNISYPQQQKKQVAKVIVKSQQIKQIVKQVSEQNKQRDTSRYLDELD